MQSWRNSAKGGESVKGFLKFIAILIVLALIAAAVLYFLGFFKSEEEKIRDCLSKFETSYNQGDLDGVADCLDNTGKSMINMASTLTASFSYGGISGKVNMADLFGFGVGATAARMQIEILSVDIYSESEARVDVVMHFSSSGNNTEEGGKFIMVKQSNAWVIDTMRSGS